MNCLPVIEMEIRSASRRPWTHGLRLLFAASGVGIGLVMLATSRMNPVQQGQQMPASLSYVSLAFCLFAVC